MNRLINQTIVKFLVVIVRPSARVPHVPSDTCSILVKMHIACHVARTGHVPSCLKISQTNL